MDLMECRTTHTRYHSHLIRFSDIDFEYPTSTTQGKAFSSLLTELRTSLDSHAKTKGDTIPYLITVAAPATSVGWNFVDIKGMNSAASFLNLIVSFL